MYVFPILMFLFKSKITEKNWKLKTKQKNTLVYRRPLKKCLSFLLSDNTSGISVINFVKYCFDRGFSFTLNWKVLIVSQKINIIKTNGK